MWGTVVAKQEEERGVGVPIDEGEGFIAHQVGPGRTGAA